VSVPKVTVPKSAKSHGRSYAYLFCLRPAIAPCSFVQIAAGSGLGLTMPAWVRKVR